MKSVILAILICAAVSAAAPTLLLELSHELFTPGQELTAHFKLVPEEGAPLEALLWNTPFEGTELVLSNSLEFEAATEQARGEPVRYEGALARRRQPDIDDFVTVESAIKASVDVAASYRFPAVGNYRCRANVALLLSDGSVLRLQSNWASVAVLSAEYAQGTFPTDQLASAPGYTNCNVGQQLDCLDAIAEGLSATADSYDYLKSDRCSGDYVTWFGTKTNSRYNTVEDCFDSLNGVEPGVMYCNPPGCPSNVYAYVYPFDSTRTVHVCGLFFNSNLTTRAETIVHEMSHFNSLCGTDDVVYGEFACKQLAEDDPGAAVDNADNYCYFALDFPSC